jgi:hypothetical protein
MTRSWALSASVVLAAGTLAACTPPRPHLHMHAPLKAISRLDCPDSEGALQRKSAAPDARSCVYAGPRGEAVTLQLIDLNGKDASSALDPLATDLRAELPAVADKGSGGDKDNVDIDLPGVHIHAHDSGTHPSQDGAPPSTGGEHVNIDENSGVHIGDGDGKGVTINANDNGAEIHIHSNGEGNRITFILASDTPGPHGYKVVGYEARGPAEGPLAVASVKSPGEEGDDLRHDIGQLLRRNVGG